MALKLAHKVDTGHPIVHPKERAAVILARIKERDHHAA